MLAVPAVAFTDDQEHRVSFDATPWLERASDEELLNLAQIGFGGDYAADAVAEALEDEVPALKELFAYLYQDPAPQDMQGTQIGFEVYVSPEMATAWLAEQRPELAVRAGLVEPEAPEAKRPGHLSRPSALAERGLQAA